MAQYGPIPKRSEELLGHAKHAAGEEPTPITKQGPQEFEDVEAFDIDLHPTQPEADSKWEPLVKELWAAMARSPEATWMTAAGWAVFKLECEQLHRELAPQVVGYSEETGMVTKERIPMKGASLAAHMKLWAAFGMTEGDRRRMGREVTLHRPHAVDRPEGVSEKGTSRSSVLASRTIGPAA